MNTTVDRPLPTLGVYRHTSSGRVYVLEAIGRSGHTGEASVRYRCVEDGQEWHRSAYAREGEDPGWMDPNEDGTPRFTKVVNFITKEWLDENG